jgi:hypothetical protein
MCTALDILEWEHLTGGSNPHKREKTDDDDDDDDDFDH